MDVKDYCSGLQCELTGWKAKMYDIVRKLEKMPTAGKEKVTPGVNELYGIIDSISQKIEWLNSECPMDYASYKKELDNKFEGLKKKWDNVLDDASPW